MSVLLNVFETPLQNFKVWKIPIVADPRVISQEIRELSQKKLPTAVLATDSCISRESLKR